MRKTKLLYRADGGHPVGMGHIMRSLRLIRELAQILDIEALLVTRRNEAVSRVIRQADLPFLYVHWMPPIEKSIIPVLGAEEFLSVAREFVPDILVVDALDTPARGMQSLASIGAKFVTQDDRGPGRIYADLIANFLVRDPDPRDLKKGAKLVQGPQYAPLAPDYIGAAEKSCRDAREYASKVMVSMGGADATGLAVKVGRGLAMVEGIQEVTFSLGLAFEKIDELKGVVDAAPWDGELVVNAPSLLPLFASADIAVVAGGITMHEAVCCGTPAIAVCQPIDHQVLVAGWLQDLGAMISLGYGQDATEEEIAAAVGRLAADRSLRRQMAQAGPKAVDGRGARRVAEEIALLVSDS